MTQPNIPGDAKLSGEKTVHNACITRFAFETNGYQGGDGGHGGYLTLTIEDLAGTGMEAKVISDRVAGDQIVLSFMGDAEISNAKEGFRWLARQIASAVDALAEHGEA